MKIIIVIPIVRKLNLNNKIDIPEDTVNKITALGYEFDHLVPNKSYTDINSV